jgi:2'-hydroxyisoflavone reductase
MSQRALVIGGTLFIGRALVEQLMERGDDVVIMHRGQGTPWGSRVGEIRCDRNDVDAVRKALQGQRFDVIYDNVYDWQRGTSAEQVVAAATADVQGLRRYVFTSSVAVYPLGDAEFVEDAELVASDNENVYGAQKADSERALFTLHHERGVPVTTLRPAFIYGPNNPFNRERFFWDRLRDERPIIIPDEGKRTMQFVHVGDVARAAALAAVNDAAVGNAYNLANYPPVTQVEFVELLARAAGKSPQLRFVPRKELEEAGGHFMHPPQYFGEYLDIPPITARPDRLRKDLGLELRSLADGLRETYDWYREQPRTQPDYSWEDRVLASR